ncbi:MAG: hypothetical protein H0V43_02665 [Gemmatimonadales bacterium]|nr:hypothetical protein [Gemmatimonadales bacterium]
MRRGFALALALALALPAGAAAQEVGPLIRYGKWVLAAGAVSMNLLAARSHGDAEDAFDQIETACFLGDPDRCLLNVEGRYADGEIEGFYQTALHHDRMARRWLILGETALVGAAAMFVWEFTRKTHEPDNIPFEPEFRTLPDGRTRFGVRVPF